MTVTGSAWLRWAVMIGTILLTAGCASQEPPQVSDPVALPHFVHTPVFAVPLPAYATREVVLKAGRTTLGAIVDDLAQQAGVKVEALWHTGVAEPGASIVIAGDTRCSLVDALAVVQATVGTGINVADHVRFAFGRDRLVVGSDATIRSESRYAVRIYPVGDLLEDGSLWMGALSPDERLQSLIDLVTTLVDRDSWDANGGMATVRATPGRLLIYTTPEAHEQIDGLLAALRRH